MRARKLFLKTAVLFSLVLLMQCQNALAATYNVVTPVASVSVPGSLPWCIAQANLTTAPDIIQFVHAQSLDPAANSITVHSTLLIVYPAYIHGNQIKVGAENLGPQICFQLNAGATGSTITGLAIVDSSYGIRIQSNSNCHMIYGNRIGTDWADTTGLGNYYGIYIMGNYNSLGGNNASTRNIISDNTNGGVWLNTGSSHNVITGNYIGLNNAGSAGLGAQSFGICIYAGRENLIGGDRSAGLGNIVSGHSQYGIVFEDAEASGNTVAGNIVGLNLAMDTAVPNNRGIAGVSLEGNAIGLSLANYENIVAGNTSYNINFWEAAGTRPQNNIIQNNYIGTNPSSASFTNGDGIYLNDSDHTLIGGNRDNLEGNIISGNGANGGIYLIGNGNSICGNYIGTNVTGTSALQNNTGIVISGSGNLIGGRNDAGTYGNVISGNQFNGIFLSSGAGNTIAGNTIGLNANGDAPIANQNGGIFINFGAGPCLFGGYNSNYRNIISGNNGDGIFMSGGVGHVIAGNYIGCNAGGTAPLLNGSGSIVLFNSFQNMIQGNYNIQEINLQNTGTFGNTLVGNVIGVFPDQSPVVGLVAGINLFTGAHGNMIGNKATGVGNLIANANDGIVVSGAATIDNGIFGNTIVAFVNKGIYLVSSGNGNYDIPVVGLADTVAGITGTAQAGDYVEIFAAENTPGGYGGSTRYLGNATANGSGLWSLAAGGYIVGEYICATATDVLNNTSEFSLNLQATSPPGTPTHTPTITPTTIPTFTHSPTITATPTISATSTISTTYTVTGTITPTSTVTPTYTSTPTSSCTPTNVLAQVDLQGGFVLPYPNPANAEMKFVVHLDAAAEITLEIYNFSGERIASVGSALSAGRGQTLVWDCSDIAAGVYLLRVLKDGKLLETRRIAVVH
ncbi:right-handed parallel beta-helix repeat-containing protein [bacterium]|nr:right-handed parallel beta-helix repeat-containing protein [bacterium]